MISLSSCKYEISNFKVANPISLLETGIDLAHLNGHGEPDLPRGIWVALGLGEHPLPRLDDVLGQPLDELRHERLQVHDVVAVPRGNAAV